MAAKFTPEEAAEIELMLWEYDRDGSIALDTSGIIPKKIQRDLIAFLNRRKR